MRSLSLLLVTLLAGCLLYERGKGDCPIAEDRPQDGAEPAIQAELRNPQDLTCQAFGGGDPCDPQCGPCPAIDQAPPPSWGICGSECELLDEFTCGTREDCRVIKDVFCSIQFDCFTDYMGCFPVDQSGDPSIDCLQAFDGQTCSRNPACTAFHRPDSFNCDAEQCAREFALCMFEGQHPGECFAPVACDAIEPPCPSGTTPGIADLCYTGACIPLDVCEVKPL
jgi:hypothetical protein